MEGEVRPRPQQEAASIFSYFSAQLFDREIRLQLRARRGVAPHLIAVEESVADNLFNRFFSPPQTPPAQS